MAFELRGMLKRGADDIRRSLEKQMKEFERGSRRL